MNSNEKKNQPSKGESDESYFNVVNYYLIDDGRPFIQLDSSELTLSRENTEMLSVLPSGTIFPKKNEEKDPINFKARQMHAFMKLGKIFLKDEVEIVVGNSNLKSKAASILDRGKYMEARDEVKTQNFDPKTSDQILIDSDFLSYKPKEQFFEFKKNVKGKIQKRRKYEEGISFGTDVLTFHTFLSLIEMKGNVSLKKENLEAFSQQGSLFLENYNKKLKYYSLSDDVRLQETLQIDGKITLRKAFSEKLEGLISEKKIILTGLPKVFQGKDVIKGNKMIIRENVETVEVDDADTSIMLEVDKKGKI